MRPPPKLSEFWRIPITGTVCAAAVGTTLAYFNDHASVESLMMRRQAFIGEPWRLVTAALPHRDVPHIFFNLFWTWTLGSLLEERFGHARFLLFILLAAALSSAAEWALAGPAIGLSGVGYALFGALWALRKTGKYAGLVDTNTGLMFGAWFVVCVVCTRLGLMNIANVAHGAGLVFGLMVGWSVRSAAVGKAAWGLAIAAASIAVWLGATTYRTSINFAYLGLSSQQDMLGKAERALKNGRYLEALPLLQQAAAKDPGNANLWKIIGAIYYDELADNKSAADAWEKALRLDPKDVDLARHLQAARTAHEHLFESVDEGPSDATTPDGDS